MKLRAEIDIDAGRETVWSAFATPANRPRWQTGLNEVQLISGEAGAVNSSYRLSFGNGSASTAIESITEARRPDFLAVIVEDGRAKSLIVDTFTDAGDGGTRWQRFSNSRFHGIARLGAPFRIGAMRRRIEDDMQRFKLMVETEEAGRDR
jgi:uncharacterized protein YndB with AHSA1/START domain